MASPDNRDDTKLDAAAASAGAAAPAPETTDAATKRVALCERASKAIATLTSFAWGKPEIRGALGINSDYYDRLLTEVSNPAKDLSRSQLNARIVDSLESLARTVSNPPSFFGGSDGYAKSVCDELDSLEENDHHTLLSIPPPLEIFYSTVMTAALEAAKRGARLDYYLPSTQYIRWAVKSLLTPSVDIDRAIDAAEREAADRAARLFSWMMELEASTSLLLQRFVNVAKQMDGTLGNGTGVYSRAVQTIRFFELDNPPLSPNEKVVWITRYDRLSGRQIRPRIYREILVPMRQEEDEEEQTALMAPYGNVQQWCRVGYPINYTPVAILLRQTRRVCQSGMVIKSEG